MKLWDNYQEFPIKYMMSLGVTHITVGRSNGGESPIYLQFLYVHGRVEILFKNVFCICENKGADQLRSNCAADQRPCIRYIDSTVPLLSKAEISSLYIISHLL